MALCEHAILGVSHNRDGRTQEKVDRKTRKQAEKYLKKNPDFRNYKIKRVAGTEIDELKHLMPIVGNIPSVVFQIVYAAMMGVRTSIVGSSQVGRVVEAIKDSGVLPKRSLDDLIFIHEGDELSLRRTIDNGYKGLGIDKKTPLLFISADIPFAFDYQGHLCDPDWQDHIAVLNFNSRQTIFKGNDFFSRNYYQVFMDGNIAHEVKEPNIWGFTGEGIEGIRKFIDVFYSNRNGGGFSLPKVLMKGPGKYVRLMRELEKSERKEVNRCLFTFVARKLGFDYKDVARFSTVENMASVLFDGPVRVKADHDSWTMLRDIDAWHDLFFYQQVVETALHKYGKENFGQLTKINPYAEQIWALQDVMTEVGQEMPIIGEFKTYANERAKALDFMQPYREDGKLMIGPTEAENLEAAVIDLVMRTNSYLGSFSQPLRNVGSQQSYQDPEAEPLHVSR